MQMEDSVNIFEQLRKSLGCTQAHVAKHTGLNREVIHYIEHQKRNPTLKQLARLRRFYRMTNKQLGDFIDGFHD